MKLKLANHTAYHKLAARELVEGLSGFDIGQDLSLTIEDDGINLCTLLNGQKTCFRHAFDEPRLLARSKQNKQALLRACSNRKGTLHSLLDLTAGWGRDSFMLAAHGRRVTLVEQHPLVFHCLRYLLRIAADGPAGEIVHTMQAIQADGHDYLVDCTPGAYDCIYIDPMFPAHKSGARPGKELQMLQLLTANQGIEAMFLKALDMGAQRVVVKRPVNAEALAGATPSLAFREKTIRFDVYLTGAA